ncbi:MAG: alpha-hydroxy-acid oxidizing protein [Bryobacterales bacterium]|nr:alpha-hydroxy-acid oxidizing protein [Bryobacterales bacterium]
MSSHDRIPAPWASTPTSRRAALRGLAGFLLASPVFHEVAEAAATGRPGAKPPPIEDLFNTFDFAKAAKAFLDPVAWDYLAEGSEDEAALDDARRAFNRLVIRPRFLTDVHEIDLKTNVLGQDLPFPIFIDPSGGKNCFRTGGELDTARAAAEHDCMYISNGGVDDFLSSGDAPKNWWQLTTGSHLRNENSMENFVEKLEDMGATGICFTVDIMHVSHRERSIHNKFVRRWCESGVPRDPNGNLIYAEGEQAWTTGVYPRLAFPTPTWEDVKTLRDMTDLKIILKGILTSEDTKKAVEVGVDGVVVSSHGARQLDHVGGPIEALPECVEAAGGKIAVLVDGGFRRGTDVLKALALGADAVGVARPYLWGLTLYGEQGVYRVIELLKTELALDMGMAGVASVGDIDRKLVRVRDYELWGPGAFR